MRERVRRLANLPFVRDIFVLQFGSGLSLVCGLLSSILTTRFLGLEQFGTYAIILSFAGVCGIAVQWGQYQVAGTYLAEAWTHKNLAQWKSIERYYWRVTALSTVAMLLVIAATPTLVTAVLGRPELGLLTCIPLFSSLLDAPFSFMRTALLAQRNVRLLAALENGREALQLAILGVFLWRAPTVLSALLAVLATTVVALVAGIGILASVRRGAKEHLSPDAKDPGTNYAKEGLWMAVEKGVSSLYPDLLFTIAARTLPVGVMGLLRLALKLSLLPVQVFIQHVSRMLTAVLPKLQRTPAFLAGTLLRTAAWTLAGHLALSAALLLVAPFAIPLVYGARFAPAVYPLAVFLCLHAVYVVIMFTPFLRLNNAAWTSAVSSGVSLVAGCATFLAAQPLLGPLWSLYAAIGIYHACSLSILVPLLRTLRSLRSASPA